METSLALIADTVWFTPSLLVITALLALVLEVVHRKERLALTAAGPRPPGESLRLNLDSLNEKLVIRVLIAVGVAVLTGMAAKANATGQNLPQVHALMFAGSGVALALTLWAWNVVTRWRTLHVGFAGERMVGRELNLLMLDGCRVFHDLVHPRIGNLDHIVVADHAIFVIETQTFREHRKTPAGADTQVIYNGKELRFPTFRTDQPLLKAVRNAKWLEGYLLYKTGLKLPVRPILALPGCVVERTVEGPVTVVNPKELSLAVVDKGADALYEAQRQRIIEVLDEKCQCSTF